MVHQARTYPNFCSVKPLGAIRLPSGWDAWHRRVTPSINPLERGIVKVQCPAEEQNTNACLRPQLKPRLLDLEMRALTMSMARISYQNSTFRSFYKFDIRLLNWTFVLFISTFVLFASAFVFQGDYSFYINNIRFSKWTFA